ncbi:MAG: tRNA pseudouridine(38-40) synthase TruA [Pyrinomonadaceae bacterium]|nr:tRNA pseudouridine(38-40) synthase TruA [Pyrinomonadaceae bacterium]MCX7640823.1 tRNA pseudouridine(38-40) synthase TruA [Pyrinomonadaceae bacterium]MDW8303412.1 tRNA pseudouridine(38-40) synthase TruA [Acidobacteriota bacterium]
MPTWKLEIEYNGTRYRGWQVQKNARTVQGELLDVARKVFPDFENVEIGGAGRTDAGVHAVGQVAHLRVPSVNVNLKPCQIQQAFNSLLPHDINILKVESVPNNFHARHDALSRYYLYQISTRRTAFGKNFVWWIKEALDINKMKAVAETLVGRHDFRAFCDSDNQSTIVVVEHSEIFVDGSLICFRIGASHFLWRMVRRLVGVMVEVGKGSIDTEEFRSLFHKDSSVIAKFTAPPSGLFLEKVLYKGDKPPLRKKAIFPIPEV